MRTGHCESLACTGLSIAKNTSRVSIKGTGKDLLGAEVVDYLLGAVHENFFELESPLVLGVIDDALVEGFLDVDVDGTKFMGSGYPVC